MYAASYTSVYVVQQVMNVLFPQPDLSISMSSQTYLILYLPTGIQTILNCLLMKYGMTFNDI